jgi:uncharacterized membrane protein YhaH (DUF805 family)
MKRASRFALAWLLILCAFYCSTRAVQVYLDYRYNICRTPFCGEDFIEFLSRRFDNIFGPSGWIIRGPLLAVLLVVIAVRVFAEAKRTPKTIHLMPSLFGVSGRGGRKDFWLALLFWTVTVLSIMGIIDLVDILMPVQQYYTIDESQRTIVEWMGAPRWIREPEKLIFTLWLIAGLISMVIVSIRRVHDRGRSGWWLLPMYLLAPWAIIELGFCPAPRRKSLTDMQK